ncbi:unnamed protein product [Adineta ricciae]|uniref:RING-type domain-containing protein n=1 Tax=Adineta ricciae TaxID=249248 RepID=A0A814PNX6_ADIRI|nr:unnamed protein product [Adineta ricciae]
MIGSTHDIIKTTFNLHSKTNRRLYSGDKYPLTYLLDYQTIHEYYYSKQPTYGKRFKISFALLTTFVLICTIVFRVHIYAYNSFFGPFHLDLNGFIQHVKDYDNGQSWFKRIEYIQVELGQNNIQNPSNTYETLRRYSDPFTRRRHIATYKKTKTPAIYVKLPTRAQTRFHERLPFDFSLYSVRTLRCIVSKLSNGSESVHQTWIEKSEYVKYINEQYSKNSVQFNTLVISKCGIVIGYLYRPLYEKAFYPTREHSFSSKDIAFDMTHQYFSFYSLVIVTFIFLCLFLIPLSYLILYVNNITCRTLLRRYGLFSFPLALSQDVVDELWLLNIDKPVHEQLLQLDEMIQGTKHKFQNQLFIIENQLGELFVVLLRVHLRKTVFLEDKASPFIICPVTNINKIVEETGICYGIDLSWIPWTSIMTYEHNYSNWLHLTLMEISDYYKKQYQYRLEHEHEVMPLFYSNFSNFQRQRKPKTEQEVKFEKYVHEEENDQRLKRERQSFYERLTNPTISASPQFIANFRMKEKTQVDTTMENEGNECVICLESFKQGDSYEEWPCPSPIPHIFHYDCMLDYLRSKHTCPICRHPVEPSQFRDDGVLQFLMRFNT